MELKDKIIAAVNGYIDGFSQGSADAIMALYADECSVEDPVGTPLKNGRDEVRAFYEASMTTGAQLSLEGPIRVAGKEAAFPFKAVVTLGDTTMEIHVIDVMEFNEDGKIIKMRAFFGEDNMKTV